MLWETRSHSAVFEWKQFPFHLLGRTNYHGISQFFRKDIAHTSVGIVIGECKCQEVFFSYYKVGDKLNKWENTMEIM